MKKQTLLTLIALSGTAVLGLTACGPSEEPKHQAAAPEGTAETEPTMMEKAAKAAKEAGEAASEKMRGAAQQASEAADAAMAKGKEMTAAAVEKGKALAGTAGDKTHEMIQQVKDYIAENKPEMAKGVMDKLHAAKDSLPESVKSELARLDAMMGAGKPELTPATAPAETPAPMPAAAPAAPPAAQ